jgi:hypothetical protein
MTRILPLLLPLLLLLLAPSLALGSVELKSGAGTDTATIDPGYKALRVSVNPRSKECYSVSQRTGTIAAAAAAGAAIYTQRISPTGGKSAYIYKIAVDYLTQVVYTTPLSAVRALVVSRGAGAAASGGTALDTFIHRKDPSGTTSQVLNSAGGDVRISTTGALTVTGITWENPPLALIDLGASAVGAAGGVKSFYWTPGEDVNNHAIELDPGMVLGIRVGPSAMDAAGTWTAVVTVEWCEY